MIPPFSAGGLIPPFVGAGPHQGSSPYITNSLELVQRFATSTERIDLLLGLFGLRGRLLALGLSGLQCINGSFCEDIETTQRRPPGDIDVVTFHDRPAAHAADPAWQALVTANLSVFDPPLAKAMYSCDAYFVDITLGAGHLLEQTIYWINLFTHKKVTYEWKGAVALNLPDPTEATAIDFLVNAKTGP